MAPRSERERWASSRTFCRARSLPGNLCHEEHLDGGIWIFNAVGFDHGSFVVLGSVDLFEMFDPHGLVLQLPWRMCARVRDSTLDWKVWPAARSEPAWGDAIFGTTITLPAEWVYAGRPGFYVGHLDTGDDAEFTDESVTALQRDQ